MIHPSSPPNEHDRLRGLRRLNILDTASEPRFDRLAELAGLVIGTPIALVSLIDEHRQWFKARVGLDATETPREISFCAHAIVENSDDTFVVEDTLTDPRFVDNPLVTGDPNIRFYAGRVLHDRDGMALGTLCVIDRQPRQLDAAQLDALAHIAVLVEQELERQGEAELIRELAASERSKSAILVSLSEGLVVQDSHGRIVEWNPAAERLLGVSAEQLDGRRSVDPRWTTIHRDGTPWPGLEHPAMVALRTGEPVRDETMGVRRDDGSLIWLRVTSQPIVDDSLESARVLTVFTDITVEVEEAERTVGLQQELAQSDLDARVSLDALEQGVILASSNGLIRRMNPAATRILGYSAADLGMLWVSPEWITYDEAGNELPFSQRPIVRAIANKRPVVGETIGWRRSDGKRIMIRISCVPTPSESEQLVIAFTDITEEHLASRLLDATLETAPVGLAILDAQRSILRCNPTFAEQAGRTAEELIGMDVVSLLHPSSRPTAAMVGQDIRHAVSDRAEIEQRVLRPDGTQIWVNTHLAVLSDPDRPLTIAATFDITERRMMLDELSRFSHLFEHANDIITVVDANGQVMYASPSTQRLLGYPSGYRPERGIFDVVHRDDVGAAITELRSLIAGTSGSRPFSLRVITASGREVHLECVGVNLLHESAVNGVVITARDATERIHLTEQLAHRAMHDELTDLPNRQMLATHLDRALATAQRNNTRIGLCFVDLDGFKGVNDTFGHAAGDDLLVTVADRLRRSIRAGDMAARIGGDEFVIVLDPVLDSSHALKITNRLRDALIAHDTTGASPADIGASIGLAISQPEDTSASLLRRADGALYGAKVRRNSTIELAPPVEMSGTVETVLGAC